MSDPLQGGPTVESIDPMTCRVCGCTDEDACEGGCSWVKEDLCGRCELFDPEADFCDYCGSLDCMRMGGLVLCTQPQTGEGG